MTRPFPWRDLYPLAGQTVMMPDGRHGVVLKFVPDDDGRNVLSGDEVGVMEMHDGPGAGPWTFHRDLLIPSIIADSDQLLDSSTTREAFVEWAVEWANSQTDLALASLHERDTEDTED